MPFKNRTHSCKLIFCPFTLEKHYSEKADSNDENETILNNDEDSVDDDLTEKSYKCEFVECKTIYKNKNSLWKHMNSTHGGKEFKCDFLFF